jgi:asparagine synthase (glutamine-hydrolysing)
VPVDMVDIIHFNKMAREISTIRMTGKYGSQVLKNVVAFKDRSPYPGLVTPEFEKYLSMARDTAQELDRGRGFSFLLAKEIPWWWNGMLSAESSQVEVRSPFLDNDLVELLYRGSGPDFSVGKEFQLRLISRSRPSLMTIPTTGTHGGVIPIVSGLRKRFISALMIADKLYTRERLPNSLTHIVARLDRYFLSPLHLAPLLFGFGEFRQYRTWFRDELSGFLRETLPISASRGRPYWSSEYLSRILADHIAGRGSYLREIRKVLQLEMIERQMLERGY